MKPSECPYPLNTLIPNLTYEQYAAVGGVRGSHLKKMMRSPEHFKFGEPEDSEKDHFRIGRHIHSLMEFGEVYLEKLTVMPVFTGLTKDGRESTLSGEAKKKKQDWLNSLPEDAMVVTQDEYINLVGVIKSVAKDRFLANLLKGASRESSLFVECPETGLLLQCRLDAIAVAGYLVDYKSTRDARWDFFQYQVFSRRMGPFYILSAAHYTYCARVAGLVHGDKYMFIAIEKEKPWGVFPYPMDSGQLEVGEMVRAQLMRLYARCAAENRWPGYPSGAVHTTIPQFVDYPYEGEFAND